MTYPFECECGTVTEVDWPMVDRDNLPTPQHCGKPMGWKPCVIHTKFAQTTGRDSGIYQNDYGKRATEDLTPPGKWARLRKEGIVTDPFLDNPAPRKAPDADTIKAFS